jgi:hypothetical protein
MHEVMLMTSQESHVQQMIDSFKETDIFELGAVET